MHENNTFSSTRLFLRSLLPSGASIAIGILISVVLVSLHILFFSLQYGSFTPALSSDQSIQNYTNFIIRPVEVVIHDSLLNTLLTALVWGLVGLIIYTTLEAIINGYHTYRSDQHEVRVVDSQRIELHPLRRWLVTRALWRLLISILGVLLVILTGSLAHTLLVSLDRALDGKSVLIIAGHVGLAIGVWTLLIHGFVVLLRLFMFRTRVLGELIL